MKLGAILAACVLSGVIGFGSVAQAAPAHGGTKIAAAHKPHKKHAKHHAKKHKKHTAAAPAKA